MSDLDWFWPVLEEEAAELVLALDGPDGFRGAGHLDATGPVGAAADNAGEP